ncbi:MAG: LLM class flavin-dependent oxidoreductase, partial [Acidobacteriota bacterium]
VSSWRERVEALGGHAKPAMQPLYVDLTDDPDAPPQPIHLGLRLGLHWLRTYLRELEEAGINHVALNLRFNRADIETTMKRLADGLLPDFSG